MPKKAPWANGLTVEERRQAVWLLRDAAMTLQRMRAEDIGDRDWQRERKKLNETIDGLEALRDLALRRRTF